MKKTLLTCNHCCPAIGWSLKTLRGLCVARSQLGVALQVAMEHVNQAVEEMFSEAHMQLLANCCRLEKLLLACLLLELRARGQLSKTGL